MPQTLTAISASVPATAGMNVHQMLSECLEHLNGRDVPDFLYVVNRAQREVYALRPWTWFQTRYQFSTEAPYTTGTVEVTDGSTTVTGTTTVWTSSHVGWRIRIGSDTQTYTVSAVGGNTTLTLDRAYDGDSDDTLSYSLFKDLYSAPSDMGRPVTLVDDDSGLVMHEEHATQFVQSWGYFGGITSTNLLAFCWYGQDSSDNRQMWLRNAPTEAKPYSLYYYRDITLVNSPWDSPDYPTWMHYLVFLWVLKHYLGRFFVQDQALQSRKKQIEEEYAEALRTCKRRDMQLTNPIYQNFYGGIPI